MSPILTIDTGLSNMLKIATVDDSYNLQDLHQEPIAPENLQGKIIQEVLRSGLEELAISSTWFVSEAGKRGFIEKDGEKVVYLDLNEIHRRVPLKKSALYNDAEATALALNIPKFQKRIIQEGDGFIDTDTKTLVYLGTGFQMVRTYFEEDTNMYLPEYGGGLMASIPISLLDDVVSYSFLNVVAENIRLKSMAQLRHTHLLSARGLSNIHAALKGEMKEAKQLIEEGIQHQQTFTVYSRILGRCLQNFASTAGFDQALYLGGTFATAIAPHLDFQAIKESFAVPHHVTREAYERTPIILLNEPFAGNLGAAYGLLMGIETKAGIPWKE